VLGYCHLVRFADANQFRLFGQSPAEKEALERARKAFLGLGLPFSAALGFSGLLPL
jgi:hypothetical protein